MTKQHICFAGAVQQPAPSEQQDIIPYVVCHAGTHEGAAGTATITPEAMDAFASDYPSHPNYPIGLFIGHDVSDDSKPRYGDFESFTTKEIDVEGVTKYALVGNLKLNDSGKELQKAKKYKHFSVDGSCTPQKLDLSHVSVVNFPAVKSQGMSRFEPNSVNFSAKIVASSDKELQEAKKVIFSQPKEQSMPEQNAEAVALSAKLETAESEKVELSAKLKEADKQVVELSAANKELEASKVELSAKLKEAEKQVAELSQEKVIAERNEVIVKKGIVDKETIKILLSQPTPEAFNDAMILATKPAVAQFSSKELPDGLQDAIDQNSPTAMQNQRLSQNK